ncbi:MAG TPA: hypothetical protein PKN63_07030 [Chitinophagales bacterium]|nr:hypothetical protein [Chitinophagales bacterium]
MERNRRRRVILRKNSVTRNNSTNNSNKTINRRIAQLEARGLEVTRAIQNDINTITTRLNNQETAINNSNTATNNSNIATNNSNTLANQLLINQNNINKDLIIIKAGLFEVRRKIELTIEQIDLLKSKISEIAQDKIKSVKLEDIIPEPLDGEEAYLKDLIAGLDNTIDDFFREVSINCLSSLAQSAVKMGLKTFNNYREHEHNLDNKDILEQLKVTFVDAFTRDLFKMNNKNNLFLAAAELAIKTVAVVGIVGYQLHKRNRKKSQILENVGRFLEETEEQILPLLKEATKDYFNDMIKLYKSSYRKCFNRDDIILTGGNTHIERHLEGDLELYTYIGEEVVRHPIIRKSTLVKGFQQKIYPETNQYDEIYPNRNSERFELSNFIKEGLNDKQMEKLTHYLRVYMAFHEEGEFISQKRLGNANFGEDLIMSTVGGVLSGGIGFLYGIYKGIEIGIQESEWTDSKNFIFNKIRILTANGTDESTQTIIKRRVIIFRLENYVQNTDSAYGRHILKKYTEKYKYAGIGYANSTPEHIEAKRKEFDTLIDLYFKIHNEAYCNREQVINSVLRLENVTHVQTSVSKAVQSVIKSGHQTLESLAKETTLSNEVVTETVLVDGSKQRTSIKEVLPNTPSNILSTYSTVEDLLMAIVS